MEYSRRAASTKGLLKLYFAEFYFRNHATPHDKMKEHKYRVFVMPFRFLSNMTVDFLRPGKDAIILLEQNIGSVD